ncbi:MAG: PilW family protein [Bacteroidales bacterium]
MRFGRRQDAGFTLVELMIATGISMTLVAAVFSVLRPSEGAFQAQPEFSDMQQRLRFGVEALGRDLLSAGSGVYSGARVGALSNFFAPIMPFRVGAVGSDPPGAFRADTITLLSVPRTCAQATIAKPMAPAANELSVNREPGCPPNDEACCFEVGMQGLVFDHVGAWNSFAVEGVSGATLNLQRLGPNVLKDYEVGAFVVQATFHTYYLKADDATQTYQLMHYDGDQTDLPVVDNVVGLEFAYFGEPVAPALIRPASDPTGPWTTYGPKPPALGMSYGMGYPEGENCVFQVTGGQHAPRLVDLGPADGGLVKLTAATLTDGPWCPGPASPGRFDADLLRIRRVEVRLRVQAGLKQLRGPAGFLFAKAGYARGGEMFVPDQELRFDVAPRNLNLGR